MPAEAEAYVSLAPRRPAAAASRTLLVWGGVTAGALLFAGLTLIAPWAEARGQSALAAVLYQAFGQVCHQMPERSFHLLAHPFAVCARCFGLYAGFALALALYPLARDIARQDAPARRWLFLALIPVGVDFALGFLGIWANTHLSRAATGALLGAVAAVYVAPGLAALSHVEWRRARADAVVE